MSTLFIIWIIYMLYKIFFAEDRSSTRTHTNQSNYYQRTYSRGYNNARNNFVEALLVLIAAMMKADGNPKKTELDYVKRTLLQSLGSEEEAKRALHRLRDILQMDIDLGTVTMEIRYSVDYSTRLQIIHILYGIAMADGVLTQSEKNLVFRIGYAIGLATADIESLFSTYNDFSKGNQTTNINAAYKILEINANASDDEVKKAYRNMVKKYHPDRVAQLGEAAQKEATNKFRKVQEAYETICNARGIK